MATGTVWLSCRWLFEVVIPSRACLLARSPSKATRSQGHDALWPTYGYLRGSDSNFTPQVSRSHHTGAPRNGNGS